MGVPPPTYLVDFACFKPPEELRVVAQEMEDYGKHWPVGEEAAGQDGWQGSLH